MNLLKQVRWDDTSSEDEINLSEVFGVLRENRPLIAGVTAIVLALGMAYALLGTPIYRADAMIQVDSDPGAASLNDKLGDLAS